MPSTPTVQPDPQRNTFPPFALIFAVWLIPALLSGFNSYMQYRLDGHRPDWRWVVFNSLDWLLYAGLTPLVFRTSRRFPLQRARLSRTLAVHIAGALIMCFAWGSFRYPPPFGGVSYSGRFHGWKVLAATPGLGLHHASVRDWRVFRVSGNRARTVLHVMGQARERETQAARLAAQLSEARLGALRMQLNPHFLFNSLNAITVLVRDQNTTAASRMLELLSDVLRQVLRAEPEHETTLAHELEFVGRYRQIEQVRFSDRLEPLIEVDPPIANAAVPRFILQPLVENALRHGIARRADAGVLQVSARREGLDLLLMVRDDGPGLATGGPESSGVGLANTRARLAGLYGDGGTLEVVGADGGGVIAIVRLPYHEAGSDAGEPR